MAAGKNGWKCGVVLNLTLICFVCMTLFHSGDTAGALQAESCRELKIYLEEADNDAVKLGEKLGGDAKKKGGKHKDGLTCNDGTDALGGNNGCMIDVDLKSVDKGIEKAGGGTVCASGKCQLPEGGFWPVCVGPGKPSPSKADSSTLQAMGTLIATVMLVMLWLSQVMS